MIHISQQLKFWRRIDDRCLEVIGVRESNRDANAASFMEPVGGRQKAEYQLDWFPGRDWL